MFNFGRELRHAVLGRSLTPTTIAAFRHEAQTNEDFARSIWWKGIRDQTLLTELAHIAAEHHPVNLAAFIPRFGIQDERARLEIAKTVARKAPSGAGVFIDHFQLREEKDRAEVAFIIAAHSVAAIAENIAKFKITAEQTRSELALVAAQRHGEELSQRFADFNITTEAYRLELAKVCVAQYEESPDGTRRPAKNRTSRHIENFQLTPAQLAEVARLAADVPWSDFPQYVDRYKITDQRTLEQLALTSIEKNVIGTIENIERFTIADPRTRTALARRAATREPYVLISHIEAFNLEDAVIRGEIALQCAETWPSRVAKAIKSFGIESVTLRLQLAQMAMLADPIKNLPTIINNFGLSHAQLATEVIDPAFSQLFKGFANTELKARSTMLLSKYTANLRQLLTSPEDLAALGLDPNEALALEPHERMRAIVDYIQKHVPRFDASLGAFLGEIQAEELLPAALAATIFTWDSCDLSRYPHRARAALARVSGYALPTGKLSPNSAREMWGTLMTAHELCGGAPAKFIPVTFDDRSQALRLITIGGAIAGLGGRLPQYTEPLAGAAIESEITRLTTLLERTFAHQIGLSALQPGSLERLLREWGGDITPFSVLAARFSQTSGWREELPVLADIATTVLGGTFRDRKYARTDGQLSYLNDRQLTAWRANPCSLQLHTVAPQATGAETAIRDYVRGVFETNLLMHLPENTAQQVTPATPAEVTRFVGLSERDQARERLTLAAAVGLLRTAIAVAPPEELKQAVSAIHGLKQALLRPIAEDDPITARQLSDDLGTLKDLFRSRKGTAGQGYYVFSTITDDPKLLLMTGDLVQSASCQNYRSGSMIGTLPGYVIDGNIKLALSYVVKQQLFDRTLAQIGVTTASNCRFAFNAPRQELVLTAGEGSLERQATITLGCAMRREVLRLGARQGKETPVLLTERAYLQPHPVDQAIAQQQNELATTVRTAIGAAVPTKHFTTIFPPSRNPGGVYSDECIGIKKGSYEYCPAS